MYGKNIYVTYLDNRRNTNVKKQDDYYFDNFMKCAEYSCKAAYLLKEILTEFQPEEISKKMEEIHEIERQADTQRHEITDNKELKPSIIRMNTLEEKEDELFISSMRKLHVEEQDVRNIIAWREIYTYLEKCADACEHVADIVGSVAMKNS